MLDTLLIVTISSFVPMKIDFSKRESKIIESSSKVVQIESVKVVTPKKGSTCYYLTKEGECWND